MRKKFVLIHRYLETGHVSILSFSDSYKSLKDIRISHPRSCSLRHDFLIIPNTVDNELDLVKDTCLLNICKNVAEYLAVGEYCMLKKSYFNSQAWFEKAKNASFLGANILENY